MRRASRSRGLWPSITVVAGICVGTVVARGGTPGGGGSKGQPTRTTPGVSETVALNGPFPLPFGIEQPDGLEPIGRPIVFVQSGFYYGNAPVPLRSVRAAYRVTAPDPPAVLKAWTDQLGGMTLSDGYIGPGRDPFWMYANAWQMFEMDKPGGSRVDIQLWATSEDPILLVVLDQNEQYTPTPVSWTRQGPVDVGHPSSAVEGRPGVAGDALFTEQGDTIHLPPSARALMPTLPTSQGTGGSTSVFAAVDATAAVRDLLAEAMSLDDYGGTEGPTTTETNGTVVTEASFVIPAGGWGFDVVAAQGPDDPYATVFVSSFAD